VVSGISNKFKKTAWRAWLTHKVLAQADVPV